MERIAGTDVHRAAAAGHDNIAAFQQAPLPLYGLTEAAWLGPRCLGEFWHNSVLPHATGEVVREEHSYGLIHGDAAARDQPYVHVRTSTLGTVDDEALGWILVAQAEHDRSIEEIVAATHQPPPAATEHPVDIPVDGHEERFEAIFRGTAWAARLIRATHVIVLEANRVPPPRIELVRVTDISPYIPA